jgi:AcrR family transcriptional regulator
MPRPQKGERGRETKRRIVEAATRLFSEEGYVNTTMAMIAAEAGVAVQTLYLSYGSKGAILKAAHDVAVAGDDEAVPVLDRQWVSDVRAEQDGRRALEIVLANSSSIVQRVAPIFGVTQAGSADADVAAQLQENKAARYQTFKVLVGELAKKPGFAPDLSVSDATDILYALLSSDVHRLFVIDRRWPIDRWKAWTHDAAIAQLFPAATSQRKTSNRAR